MTKRARCRSAWTERDAKAAVDHYGKAGVGADLALRIYSTQLLGRDAKLVLHGGGNTSLKTKERDLTGEEARGAARQRLGLGHGLDRARRLAGGAARAAAPLARARRRSTTTNSRACSALF